MRDSSQSDSGRLTGQSTLSAAIAAFREHMMLQGFAENTVKAFLGDLSILVGHVGADKPIGEISNWHLNDFLAYLLLRRGKPCSPKSYARRLTALKVFFSWLAEIGAVPTDPAVALVHRSVTTPLPRILRDDQVGQLLLVSRDLLLSTRADARPYLLVSLLLQTGMKKSECMGIRLGDLDLSDAQSPSLRIRYDNPRMTYKERTLALSPQIVPMLNQYLRQYKPSEMLFECTARNLEYVLRNVAELAEIDGGVAFEQLRWTAAVRDYLRGTPEERLRQKMGLSRISWRETLEKIKRLASPTA
ncbi:MAG TPA: tyrosine-type recombinase/integrase [Anaerolineae bacterium]|nr:tyrosine-type recombinase/integrase [Anaerolineae bacterium]